MPTPRRVALAAALALALAAPLAGAQAAGLQMRLQPDSVEAPVGSAATTTVTLETGGPTPVRVSLRAQNATGNLSVTFNPAEVDVFPGMTASATASVRGATAGTWSVVIVAREAGPLNATGGAQAQALLTVRFFTPSNQTTEPPAEEPASPPPPTRGAEPPPPASNRSAPPDEPPPERGPGPAAPGNATDTGNDTAAPPAEEGPSAPADQTQGPPAQPPAEDALRADATQITLRAARGERASFLVRLDNPRPVDEDADVTLRLPLGWGGALDAARVRVPADGSALVGGHVVPTRSAGDAEGSLEIRSPAGDILVRLHLRVVETPAAPPPAPPADAPARATEVAGATDPPREPPTPRVAVRVEPADVRAPPGATILVTVFVTNTGDAPASGDALLHVPPFVPQSAAPSFALAPGAQAAIVFTIFLDGAAPDAEFQGSATTTLGAGQPAGLRIHVSGADAPLVRAASAPDASASYAWVALGAGAAATLVALWRRAPGFGLLALYARLAPRRALEHPRRAALVELLRREPGSTLADVQRALGLSNGVARHHVALLQTAGVVRSVQDGALRRLWLVEAGRVAPTPALRERALGTLRSRGPMRAADLAAALGVSRQALHYHLKRLEAEGEIVATRGGGDLVLAPTLTGQP